MFDKISCFISGDKIELNNQVFLLGELTADLLGITKDEYIKMRGLSEKLRSLLRQGDSGETLFELRVEMGVLRSLLMKRKLFQTLAVQTLEDDVDDDFPRLFKIPEELREEPSEGETEEFERMFGICEDSLIIRQAEKYCEIVDDVYAFNQTMFWFIDNYLDKLKKLNAENYAAALFGFLNNPRREKMIVNPISSDGQAFTVFDPVQIQYIPREIPGSPDNYAIYEYYHIEHLQSFLKVDFYRALMAGHVIRRCKNCKLFFLSTDGIRTKYCDRPIPGKPNRNCRNQGAKNTAKELAKNDPVRRSYKKVYNFINSDCNRGKITEAERNMARDRARDIRDESISKGWLDAKVEELLRADALYAALRIKRK